MPPLKEPVFAPAVPEPDEPSRPTVQIYPKKREQKPRIHPREAAENAINQIATVPPRLMLYSILGAIGLILVAVPWHFLPARSPDHGSTAPPPRPTAQP